MSQESFAKRRPALVYGVVTGVVIFFIGYVTGMGGSFLPNVIFGALMGVFAGICFKIATRIGGKKR